MPSVPVSSIRVQSATMVGPMTAAELERLDVIHMHDGYKFEVYCVQPSVLNENVLVEGVLIRFDGVIHRPVGASSRFATIPENEIVLVSRRIRNA